MLRIKVYCPGPTCEEEQDCPRVGYVSRFNDRMFNWECQGVTDGGVSTVEDIWESVDINKTSLLAIRLLYETHMALLLRT